MLTQHTPSRPLLALKGAILLSLASQVNVSLLENGFFVSAAVVLLPLFLFLDPEYPVFLTAAFGGLGMFLLRSLLHGGFAGGLPLMLRLYGPEIVFFLVYGGLLALYMRAVSLRPFRVWALLPLVPIDFLANLSEVSIRYGAGAFTGPRLLVLLGAALGRSLLIAILLWTLDSYGVALTRRENAERYQRLVLMTAALKGELAWLKKNAFLIEDTMSAAYGLYTELSRRADPQAQTALRVAKDIHDVKKEYLLIIRGIDHALGMEEGASGMYLSEILEILQRALNHAAEEAGREICWRLPEGEALYTRQHYTLMAILHNLFSNALEAAQGPCVEIGFSHREEGETLVLTVSDDAGGIPEERLPSIFLPGFSTKLDEGTGQLGRGLGLALVGDLVRESLGGEILVESGQGHTVFTIRAQREKVVGP